MRLYTIAMRVKEYPRLAGSSACTFFIMAEGGREAECRSLEISRFFRFSPRVNISCIAQGMLEYVLIGGMQKSGSSANRNSSAEIRGVPYGPVSVGHHFIHFPGWHHS